MNRLLSSEGSQLSSTGAFFPNANGCSFNHSTFTVVHGNMTVVYSGEQSSLVRKTGSITTQILTTCKWNKYRLVDFDQQTLRYLRTSPTGIVTMEMEPMALTSHVKMYRIHWYRDREDIFYDHLGFAKSPCVCYPVMPFHGF
jgi:hypothetical protein